MKKYYDIHVNDTQQSYSVFIDIEVKPYTKKEDINVIAHAIEDGKLDDDDRKWVDTITEISKEEYERALKA